MPYTGGGSSTPGEPAPAPRLAHRHVQAQPATHWLIAHGLGFRPAGVLVTDTDGNPVVGVVDHPDTNTARIRFDVPISGTADLS